VDRRAGLVRGGAGRTEGPARRPPHGAARLGARVPSQPRRSRTPCSSCRGSTPRRSPSVSTRRTRQGRAGRSGSGSRRTPRGRGRGDGGVGYQAWVLAPQGDDLAGLVTPTWSPSAGSRSNAEAFHKVLTDLRPDYLSLRSRRVDANRHYTAGRSSRPIGTRRFRGGGTSRCGASWRRGPEVWGPTSFLTIYRRRGDAS